MAIFSLMTSSRSVCGQRSILERFLQEITKKWKHKGTLKHSTLEENENSSGKPLRRILDNKIGDDGGFDNGGGGDGGCRSSLSVSSSAPDKPLPARATF